MHNDLIARLEAATADQQRELLIEAFDAMHPDATIRRVGFFIMLEARAYESAALTLVPEGWGWVDLEIAPKAAEALLNNQRQQVRGNALTPALAICIAALKARGA